MPSVFDLHIVSHDFRAESVIQIVGSEDRMVYWPINTTENASSPRSLTLSAIVWVLCQHCNL
jgi:hypothetical protein